MIWTANQKILNGIQFSGKNFLPAQCPLLVIKQKSENEPEQVSSKNNLNKFIGMRFGNKLQ